MAMSDIHTSTYQYIYWTNKVRIMNIFEDIAYEIVNIPQIIHDPNFFVQYI